MSNYNNNNNNNNTINPKPCNYGCNTRIIGILPRMHILKYLQRKDILALIGLNL
jgi:hypothetical protein